MGLTKRLVVYLRGTTFVASCIIFLILFPNLAIGQGGNIAINGADYTTTIPVQYPLNLSIIAQNVSPRVIVEYADFAFQFTLRSVRGLNVTVAPRIIIEYADYAANLALLSYLGPYSGVPEFSSTIILLLFMVAALCATIIYRRKHSAD